MTLFRPMYTAVQLFSPLLQTRSLDHKPRGYLTEVDYKCFQGTTRRILGQPHEKAAAWGDATLVV